jgi:hypothetical protein
MQWSRRVQAVETSAGQLEPNRSEAGVSKTKAKAGDDLKSKESSERDEIWNWRVGGAKQVPALIPGMGQPSVDEPYFYKNLVEPPPYNSEASQAPATGSLVAQGEAPAAPAELAVAEASKQSSSYSLNLGGQGGGLSGSSTALSSSGVDGSEDNSSLPPIAQERFEPFGYPGAGLLLELHLPEITLKQLHSDSRGSLAQFLLEVREQMCKSVAVPEARISILGIHGRYRRYDNGGLFHVRSERTGSIAGPQHLDEEVVVRFEILPGWTGDADPKQVLSILEEKLSSESSGLKTGPLSTVLLNASVTLSSPAGLGNQPRMVEHRGIAHMSAMAWPIGISAAFIGILIWLAAY